MTALAMKVPMLEMWVVYKYPKDFPDDYVIRHWKIDGKELIACEARIEKTINTVSMEAQPKKSSSFFATEDLEKLSLDQYSELKQGENRVKEAFALFLELLANLGQSSSLPLNKFNGTVHMRIDKSFTLMIHASSYHLELESTSVPLKKDTSKMIS